MFDERIHLTKILSVVKEGQQKYCETVYSRSGINHMWILKNSKNLYASHTLLKTVTECCTMFITPQISFYWALQTLFRYLFCCVFGACSLSVKWFNLQMFVVLLTNNVQSFFPKITQQILRCRNISKIQ